jgi:hypothetical protein
MIGFARLAVMELVLLIERGRATIAALEAAEKNSNHRQTNAHWQQYLTTDQLVEIHERIEGSAG